MRAIRKTVSAVVALLVSLSVSSVLYASAVEGTDYVVLEKPIPNSQNTLIKVFSYDCPFCYKYDKSVTPNVVEKIKGSIAFEPWHLKNKGKYGNEGNKLFAVLIVKDTKAGISLFDDKSSFKKAKFAYYTAYHDKKERWDAGAEAFTKVGMDASGLTQAEFDTLLKDPKTVEMLARWESAIEIAKVQGVPAFVVNGKYLIYTKSIKSVDGLVEVIKELSAKK